jgi:hypothetical protein
MKNIIYNLYKFSLLILFLQSMFAWFLWDQLILVLLISFSFTFFFVLTNKGILNFKKSYIIPIVLLGIIQLYVVRDMNVNALISALLRIFILSIVLILNDQIKIDLLNYFTKAFAILLSISLFAWIIFLFGINLPYTHADFNAGQYWFNNYYFFLDNLSPFEIFRRFSSVFLEPGQLGVITAFFLYANKFELKRKTVLIIFIATLFTLSLAAYLLLLISVSAYVLISSRKPMWNFILWCLCLFSIYVYFSNLNNGANIVNNLILERLYIEDGDLTGNNRFSSDMDRYFDSFVRSADFYTGIGAAKYQMLNLGPNAGYKVYIVNHGIIGTLFVFLLYLLVALNYKSKLSIIFLVVYILCFIQAAYPLWECELLIFITAMPLLKTFQKKEINENAKKD